MQEETNLEVACNKWYKTIDSILHQCFKKIRITSVPPKRTLDFDIYQALLEVKKIKEMITIAGDMQKPVLRCELNRCELKAAELQGNRVKQILSEDRHLTAGAFSFNEAWKLKKKLFPRCADAPFAVLDKNHNLVADYMRVYWM